MISPELLRRYPFFGGLSHQQIVALAKVSNEVTMDASHYFFHEGDELENVYLVLEGAVAIVFKVPDRGVQQNLSAQLTGNLQTTDVAISSIGPGEIFGWSALVYPYKATASGKAATRCRVVVFDCRELRKMFDGDCQFGYLMIQKITQVIRNRLHDMRIESLAQLVG